MSEPTGYSRRSLLKGAVLFAGASLASGLSTREARAQKKASKESMKYQDKPMEGKQCSNYAQFVAPDSCKVVEGKISPQGYCVAWQKQ